METIPSFFLRYTFPHACHPKRHRLKGKKGKAEENRSAMYVDENDAHTAQELSS
jgi:hypothetical protein